jgi:type VI secretion system protein ImpK
MTAVPNTQAPADTGRRRENLAFCFQEVLTAIVRLRANSQSISDPAAFRQHIRAALKAAEQEAAHRGYLNEDIRLCTFAVVAFLDESILNSQNPAFADWPRKPLQEELFGVFVAGEIFFRNLERLLTRPDSHVLADILEVHLLCMQLGFRGKFSLTGSAELRSFSEQIKQKIGRIRGHHDEIVPNWAPPAEAPRLASDPWLKHLLFGAAGICGLAIVLFLVYYLVLGSGVSSVESTAALFRV